MVVSYFVIVVACGGGGFRSDGGGLWVIMCFRFIYLFVIFIIMWVMVGDGGRLLAG